MDRGMILLWSGSIVTIPAGWILCDGNNGTPDLTNQFVVGAGGVYAVGATGGAPSHSHPFTTDGHEHTIPAGMQIETGTGKAAVTSNVTDSGTTNNDSSLPPYYALAYIMKT